MKETWTTNSQQQTESLGMALAEDVGAGDVVALYGELGAGKTALIRGILRKNGVTEPVVSPTFQIVNEYPVDGGVAAHFDMYRIDGEQSLESTGFYDYLGRALLLIEWSEHIEWALDDRAIRISIKGAGDEERTVTVARGEPL